MKLKETTQEKSRNIEVITTGKKKFKRLIIKFDV